MKLTNWATDWKARCGLRGFTEKKKQVKRKLKMIWFAKELEEGLIPSASDNLKFVFFSVILSNEGFGKISV